MIPVLANKKRTLLTRAMTDYTIQKVLSIGNWLCVIYPLLSTNCCALKCGIPSHIDMDDLHGVAIIGLMHALEKFSTSDEITFGAYVDNVCVVRY